MTAKLFITIFMLGGAAVFSIVNLCGQTQKVLSESKPLTFNKDIAPVMFENCAVCHHPGGSAPFSLTDFSGREKTRRANCRSDKKPLYAAVVA